MAKKVTVTPAAALDAAKVFHQAASFEWVSSVLMNLTTKWIDPSKAIDPTNPPPDHDPRYSDVLPPTLITAMVNSSFAIELYLKTLLVLEGRDVPHIHNYVELFEPLSATNQAMVKAIYEKAVDGSPFFQDLKTHHGVN